jgi:hypothetical protein
VTVPLAPLTVTVHDTSNNPVAGAYVAYKVATDSQMSSACSDTTTYMLSGTTGVAGTVTAGVPFGEIKVFASDSLGNPLPGGTSWTGLVSPGTGASATVTN